MGLGYASPSFLTHCPLSCQELPLLEGYHSSLGPQYHWMGTEQAEPPGEFRRWVLTDNDSESHSVSLFRGKDGGCGHACWKGIRLGLGCESFIPTVHWAC